MIEYIDKNKLLEELRRDFKDDCNVYFSHVDKVIRDEKYEFAINEIQDATVENVKEVIHADWIEGRVDGRVCINCSNCGSIIPTDTQVDYLSLEDNKYCYWCGAVMGK